MSWLSRFLGFDEILIAKDGEIVNLYTQLHNYQAIIETKDHEIRRLNDLMLTEHGVIPREGIPQEKKTFTPLNRRPNFRSVQRQLEEADRGMASKQVDAIKEYWEKKQADDAAQEVKAN